MTAAPRVVGVVPERKGVGSCGGGSGESDDGCGDDGAGADVSDRDGSDEVVGVGLQWC